MRTATAAIKMATIEVFTFQHSPSLLHPRCTIPHVKEPITILDQISFTSKIFCVYAQYGKSNPSIPTHVTRTGKTNAKTATNARFQIDSVWGLHKVMQWKPVASTPVAQKSNSSVIKCLICTIICINCVLQNKLQQHTAFLLLGITNSIYIKLH
jgi:hypothetical protein